AADPGGGRFALADGASESSFAALWAQLLTEAFLAAPFPGDVSGWLDGPRGRWRTGVMGLELPWYAETNRETGAFAALVGVDLRPPEPQRRGAWRAVAIGDPCLVRVREGKHLRAFPVRKARDFDNQPTLLGSRPGPLPKPGLCSGSLWPGDRIF